MSASSSSSTRKFDVFVSFRGQETRKTFVSHLRFSLDRRGIATLEDENELRGGQSDPSVVDRTIGESKVAVVLISEKYASSPWSLESLVKIMAFHHSGLLSVIPVFYDIDPSDVKKQSGKLWEPFSLHERENPTNVQTWRQTLSQLADSPSCQYSENWKGDAEMIGKITDDIWDMLIGSKSSDLCGLVGMDRHIKAMYRLLDFGLKDDVRLIQIWGRVGIGKTELAKYLYKEVMHHFDTHFWLDIPKERDNEGNYARNLIKKLYSRKQAEKVLIVVDTRDAENNISQFQRELRYLARDLGPGSRVFIITKQEQSLHYSQVDFRYEVVGLEFSESLELFCLRAFKQTHPLLGFEEVSCRAVKLTGGSPPTINKLGSRLSGRDKDEWDVILSAYERSSDKGIIIHPDKIIFDPSVTDSVSTQSRTTINHSKDLVGMNSRMQAVLGLLELGSDTEVRVVGIWGTGGIGKTTLARPMNSQITLLFFFSILCLSQISNSSPLKSHPLPILPLPSSQQLQWQLGSMAMFLHFGPNTFTNSEWGTGKANPSVFNPTHLNASQWVQIAKDSGFSRVILTAKHHDGFCLWPSEYTDYSVKSSSWRNGTGDVVAELAAAAAEAGIGLGLYLSPWDRHDQSYGKTLEYNEFYLSQMTELLTKYGEIKEVWLDGAKGEGEKDMEYFFDTWFSLIHQLQPKAVIFSDAGPDVRWIGDEAGLAGSTCWSLFNRTNAKIGDTDPLYSQEGDSFGQDWVPAECDVSIRPGWFWHASESPKPAVQLLDIYYNSVGRNCLFLLNVPPNSSGLISEQDIKVLEEFREMKHSIFSNNLARKALVNSSSIRGGQSSQFGPKNVLEEGLDKYWAPEENQKEWELYLEFKDSVTFNVLEIREPIQMGQRIASFHLETRKTGSGKWERVVSGTTVGNKRLLRFLKVESRSLKLVVDKARTDPLISYLGIYMDKFSVSSRNTTKITITRTLKEEQQLHDL